MADKKWEEVVVPQADLHNFDTDGELVGVLVQKKEKVGMHESMLYTFEKEGEDGERVAIWGSTVLDDKLSKVVEGQDNKAGRSEQ